VVKNLFISNPFYLCIPLAPQDYQKNLASGKARAALERFIATSSVAIGIVPHA
jgi:hypothetical protein